MKWLRLLPVLLLAPAAMIFLGYLFFAPRKPPMPVTSGSITIVILDPIDPAVIDAAPDETSLLASLRRNGLKGPITADNSSSMTDTILEILNGSPINGLRLPALRMNRSTYRIEMVSPWNRTNDTGLIGILPRCNRTLRLLTDPVSESAPADTAGPAGQTASTAADLVICHIPRTDQSDPDYLHAIESRLAAFSDTIGTWIIISPMHTVPVTWKFHMNQWLALQQFPDIEPAVATLDATAVENAPETADPGFAKSLAFYADAGEKGLRINRELTYDSGRVRREDFERFRKSLAAALRTVTIPGSGMENGSVSSSGNSSDSDPVTGTGNTAGNPLFRKLLRGEQVYSHWREGMFPDLVWEQADESVAIVPELPDDPIASPWQPVAEPAVVFRPGGWCLFSGPAFLDYMQDENALDGLTTEDIAPTVLFLLSCPVPRDMPGRVLQPLMVDAMQMRVPAYVDSYSYHDPLVQQEFE